MRPSKPWESPMNTLKSLSLLVLFLCTTIAVADAARVAPGLHADMQQAADDAPIEAMLKLRDARAMPDLRGVPRLERLQRAIAHLKANANAAQAPLLADLKRRGIEHKAFWISNTVWVRARRDALTPLLDHPAIERAFANRPVRLQLPADAAIPPTRGSIEWNIAMVNAPAVWALGFTGDGAVLAGQDTGYDWDHPALVDAYRGWNGAAADHNYNWHDAIDAPNVPCLDGGNQPMPCDDNSHGTHTMGTMLGDDGAGNQVGVAPGARWIGCRNMNQGDGTPATYTECYQWFVEPTDLNDENPDAARAPHVINNSWGCPASEGCVDVDVLKPVVENVVAAGILVVSSAGNGGSGCSTVSTPSAIYAAALSVGSTTSTDGISGFSSRGPVTADGSNRLKPDISAPGSGIRSALPGGGYGNKSGTSMASPNVAGVAALLISAFPHLAGQPEQIREILLASAQERTTTQNCGALPGSASPNHTFGWGRIDALAAFQLADRIYRNGFD